MTTPASTSSSSCPSSSCTTHGPWQHFFSPPQWLVYSALVLIGIIFRWALLDMRPYHHDESLHGMYGRYFYDFPNHNFYKYDPMLHGPMLYNCMRFIYAMFGDSLWAARTPVCLMGTIFLVMPFVFRRYFSPQSVLALTGALCISPTMVYWSRFLREDFWVISAMLLCVYGLTLARGNWKALWVLLGITLQWCTKENIFVTLAIVAGFLLFDFIVERLFLRDNRTSWIERIGSYLAAHPWASLWSLVLCWFVYSWFYGAGFRFIEGLGDGLGAKGFEYWQEHHKKQRIEGPFNFHVYVLGWYELPFLLAFFLHVALFYKHASRWIRCSAAAISLAALSCYLFVAESTLRELSLNLGLTTISPWNDFKLKGKLDMLGLLGLLFHAPLITTQHALRRERTLAITGYFFTATFFVYSYLGEKVPWLTLYPYIFGLPYLALFFEHHAKESLRGWNAYPVSRLLLWVAILLIGLGMFFVAESELIPQLLAASTGLPGWSLWNLSGVTISSEDGAFLTIGTLLVAFVFSTSSVVSDRIAKLPLWIWISVFTALSCILLLLIQNIFLPSYSLVPPVQPGFALVVGFAAALAIAMLQPVALQRIAPIGGWVTAVGVFSFIVFCYLESALNTFAHGSSGMSLGTAGVLRVGVFLLVADCLSRGGLKLGTVRLANLLALVVVAYNLRATIQTNFLYAGKASEFLSQVHTTYEIAELAKKINYEVAFQPEGYQPKVFVTGDATWPLTWYFRDLKDNYSFNVSNKDEKASFTYLIQDFNDETKHSEIPEGYTSRKVPLRGWWVPDYSQMTLKNFLRYSLNHYPWNDTGFTSVIVSTATDRTRFIEPYSE